VALDVSSLAEAEAWVERLEGVPGWLKIGSQLFTAAGPAAVVAAARRARVFLDLKLHDIPNTVAGAVAAATRQGASLLTVHASGGIAMLRAAREAAEAAARSAGVERPRLVGVTVLTSLRAAELPGLGIVGSLDEQVERLVDASIEAGLDGIVASPQEVQRVRRRAGPDFLVVTPGIRLAEASADDQARVATPREAIAAGSDLLVMGRPILSAADPPAAARRVVAEIEDALAQRAA
jgi:orotidine-5'-phosphate decarboxylase